MANGVSRSARALRVVKTSDVLDVPLAFGSVWHGEVAAQAGASRPRLRGAKRRPNLETRTLNGGRIPYSGDYRLRGRWMHSDYSEMRNAAWAVRNSRADVGRMPIALRIVLAEAQRLVAHGEPLADVLEAFAELLLRP